MARKSERDRVKEDQGQIQQSTKVWQEWEDQYSCDLLESYYYGKQWQGDDSEWQKRKYVINMFYPLIDISHSSMLFQMPTYKVDPRPMRMDDPLSDVQTRAKLQEETLNTYVQTPQLGFEEEVWLAALDAEFRYAVVQVGYTNDYIDNPEAGRPVLTEEIDDQGNPIPMTDSDGNAITQGAFKLKAERIFWKWIPARNCRWSANSNNRAAKNDWFSYSEWHYTSDLKNNPRYDKQAVKEIQATGRIKARIQDDTQKTDQQAQNNMVKVWFKWDLRTKQRRIWAEGGERYLLEEDFKFLPFAFLKHKNILGQWYPLPNTFNWVHPQNELNDTREMQRVHRKRFIRRYLRKIGAFQTEEEFQKLNEGDDGVSAEVTDPLTALVPVQDAPLDPAAARNIPQSQDDLTRISGISGESQQVAQSDTATQANLIALAGRIRESFKTKKFGKFMSELGRLTLLTMRDEMALPIWIKNAVDPTSPLAQQEAQEVTKLWKQIKGVNLGDIDNDISVILSSMSPISQEQERNDWIQFLTLLMNPGLGAILSQSPILLRKTAGLFNITSAAELREVAQGMEAAAKMFAQAQAAQMAQKQGGGTAPGPTPTNNDIAGQLGQQLPVEVQQGIQ